MVYIQQHLFTIRTCFKIISIVTPDVVLTTSGVTKIDKNRYWKSIDIIDINGFNPPIFIDWFRKSIEIQVAE